MKNETRIKANELTRKIEINSKDIRLIGKLGMVVATRQGYVYESLSAEIMNVVKVIVIDDLNKQLRKAESDLEAL